MLKSHQPHRTKNKDQCYQKTSPVLINENPPYRVRLEGKSGSLEHMRNGGGVADLDSSLQWQIDLVGVDLEG